MTKESRRLTRIKKRDMNVLGTVLRGCLTQSEEDWKKEDDDAIWWMNEESKTKSSELEHFYETPYLKKKKRLLSHSSSSSSKDDNNNNYYPHSNYDEYEILNIYPKEGALELISSGSERDDDSENEKEQENENEEENENENGHEEGFSRILNPTTHRPAISWSNDQILALLDCFIHSLFRYTMEGISQVMKGKKGNATQRLQVFDPILIYLSDYPIKTPEVPNSYFSSSNTTRSSKLSKWYKLVDLTSEMKRTEQSLFDKFHDSLLASSGIFPKILRPPFLSRSTRFFGIKGMFLENLMDFVAYMKIPSSWETATQRSSFQCRDKLFDLLSLSSKNRLNSEFCCGFNGNRKGEKLSNLYHSTISFDQFILFYQQFLFTCQQESFVQQQLQSGGGPPSKDEIFKNVRNRRDIIHFHPYEKAVFEELRILQRIWREYENMRTTISPQLPQPSHLENDDSQLLKKEFINKAFQEYVEILLFHLPMRSYDTYTISKDVLLSFYSNCHKTNSFPTFSIPVTSDLLRELTLELLIGGFMTGRYMERDESQMFWKSSSRFKSRVELELIEEARKKKKKIPDDKMKKLIEERLKEPKKNQKIKNISKEEDEDEKEYDAKIESKEEEQEKDSTKNFDSFDYLIFGNKFTTSTYRISFNVLNLIRCYEMDGNDVICNTTPITPKTTSSDQPTSTSDKPITTTSDPTSSIDSTSNQPTSSTTTTTGEEEEGRNSNNMERSISLPPFSSIISNLMTLDPNLIVEDDEKEKKEEMKEEISNRFQTTVSRKHGISSTVSKFLSDYFQFDISLSLNQLQSSDPIIESQKMSGQTTIQPQSSSSSSSNFNSSSNSNPRGNNQFQRVKNENETCLNLNDSNNEGNFISFNVQPTFQLKKKSCLMKNGKINSSSSSSTSSSETTIQTQNQKNQNRILSYNPKFGLIYHVLSQSIYHFIFVHPGCNFNFIFCHFPISWPSQIFSILSHLLQQNLIKKVDLNFKKRRKGLFENENQNQFMIEEEEEEKEMEQDNDDESENQSNNNNQNHLQNSCCYFVL